MDAKRKKFKAYSLCSEINLDILAVHFGINKKYKWEDYLMLNPKNLEGILNNIEEKQAIVFPFGTIAFVNMEFHEIVDFCKYLSKIDLNMLDISFDFFDEYLLEEEKESEEDFYEYLGVPKIQSFHVQILAVVLAKSVALDRIEYGIEKMLDEFEPIIRKLEVGKLNIKEKRIAELSARVLNFKFNTLSYVMLLDEPDITWNSQEASDLYRKLSKVFELSERYDKIKAKTTTLMDIISVFNELTHQKKGDFLEWIIIILILMELMISFKDMFFK